MSFREFITNRLFRRRLESELEDFENIRPPANPSRRHIDRLVKRLLSDRHSEAAHRELEMIGRAAVPSLVAALHDQRFHQRVKRSSAMDDQPLEMVLELLVPHAPEEIASAAIVLVRSSSSEVRQTAALHLASLGREDTVPVLAELLNDADGYVRSYVKSGVQRAVAARRCSEGFRRSMYELLLNQCDQEWEVAVNDAAGAVVELDPVRAALDFSSDRWLSPANKEVYQILEVCNRAGILLPEELIRRLLDHSMPLAHGEQCYPHQYVVAAALHALALKIGDQARLLLEDALSSDQDQVQEAAARAMAKLAGLEDPIHFVLERVERVGFEGLTSPQQTLYCSFLFDAEVCNGGIMQFFGNTSGDHVTETLAALELLGHAEAERALATAMKLIGPLSRESNRDLRLAAFEDRYDELQAAFAPLQNDFYRTNGMLRQRMFLYAAANPDHFRS